VAIVKKSVAVGTDTGVSATVSVTTAETTATSVGDLVVVFHGNDFYTTTTMGTPTATGSPTMNAITTADGGSNLAHINGWWYVANTGGAQTISATETGTHDDEKAITAYVLGGADTTTPIDSAAPATGVTSVSLVAPAVTPTGSDSLLICYVNSGGGASASSHTPPPGMTEDTDFQAGGISGSAASLLLSASGSTGTKTFTAANSVPFAAVSVAIKSAAGGGAGPDANQALRRPPFLPFRAPFRGPQSIPFQMLGDRTMAASASSVSLDETATGTDALSVTVTLALADTGTGSDALVAEAASALTDTGTGADALSATVAAALADASSVTDAIADTIAVALADTASVTDAVAAAIATALAETATGADAISVVTGTDPYQAGSQIAWMFLHPNAASFQMQGSSEVQSGTTPTLPETATATDALTPAAAAALTDIGSGTDALAAAAAAPLSETVAATDALSVTVAVALTDVGSGTDALSVAGSSNPSLPEVGTGTDALSATATLPLTDTATGTDALTVNQTRALTDTGTGTDALSVARAAALAETASVADAFSVIAAVSLADMAALTDGFHNDGLILITHPVARAGTAPSGPTTGAGTAARGPMARAGSS
jgi:hypothetical protein